VDGAHDTNAGTRIVTDEQWRREHPGKESDRGNGASRVPGWYVVLAIFRHLFVTLVYMFVAALWRGVFPERGALLVLSTPIKAHV
jgi:hypothetical protein